MKQTYEQRVRALAEDFARINATALFELYDRTVGRAETVEAVERCAERYGPFAQIAIKHMAEAVMQAWNDNEPVESSRECKVYLKEQGLIPNEKEVNNDIQRTRTGHCGKDGGKENGQSLG